MSLQHAIAFFRDAERRGAFTETVEVTRKTGVEDFVDGEYVPASSTVVYAGAGRIRSQGNHVGYDSQVGGSDVRFNRFVMNVEAGTDLAVDDRVLVTSARFDGEMVGRTFRITDVLLDGFTIHRRAMLEEVS